MKRRNSTGRRVAVAVSLALHAGLVGLWASGRTQAPRSEPPIINVTLAPALLRPAASEPERASVEPPVELAAATAAISPRPARNPLDSPLAGQPAAPAQAPVGASLVPGSTEVLDGATRGALASRLACRDPQTRAERERCAETFTKPTPDVRLAETNAYVRIGEHVAIMGDVRRRENTGYRASCEGLRNLDSSCPNLLPDNLPRDFERPKD